MREQMTTAMPCRDEDDDEDALLLCSEDAGELLERGGDDYSGRPSCWAGDTAGGFGEQQLVPEERCYYPEVSTVTWDAACSPAEGCPGRPRSDDDDRPVGWAESVSWILKVQLHFVLASANALLCNFLLPSSLIFFHMLDDVLVFQARAYHGFQPATAYLAVSYMDRFLSSGTLPVSGPHHPLRVRPILCTKQTALN
jgi:cyclin D1/2/4